MCCKTECGKGVQYLLYVRVVHNTEISEGVATDSSYETGEWHEGVSSVWFA